MPLFIPMTFVFHSERSLLFLMISNSWLFNYTITDISGTFKHSFIHNFTIILVCLSKQIVHVTHSKNHLIRKSWCAPNTAKKKDQSINHNSSLVATSRRRRCRRRCRRLLACRLSSPRMHFFLSFKLYTTNCAVLCCAVLCCAVCETKFWYQTPKLKWQQRQMWAMFKKKIHLR